MGNLETIESFFLRDYEKLREENEALRENVNKLEEQINVDEGFRDLHAPINMVKITTDVDSYDFFRRDCAAFKDKSVDELKAIIGMSDAELLKLLERTKVTSYGTNAITITEKTFPFTAQFKTYKGTREYAYDPDKDVCKLVPIVYEVDVDRWVVSDIKFDVIRYALEEARNTIREHIVEINEDSNE